MADDAKGFDMGEAFDKILADQEVTDLDSAPASDEVPADPPSDVPERDEAGRFASKDAPEPVAEAVESVEPAPVEPVALQAPERLPKEIREEWGKLSEPVRSAIEKRERETHDIVTRVDRERQVGRGFDQTAAEYKDIIDQDGAGKPDVAVRNLLQTARMLRSGDPATKAAMLNQIATMYGIDIEQAYYSRPQPEMAQAQLALQQRDAELAFYRGQQQQAESGQIQQTIQEFAADKPDFYDFAPEMERLATLGVSKDLSTLYNMARGGNETLRSTSQAAQSAAAETAKQNADVAKARNAAVSPPSASGHAKPPGLATLDPFEAMSLEYDAIIARNSG